ncbi:MAG: hypothetical protein R3304_10645 [Longimicrobiales bacterium]|nr:hypothetical protein [Longimicrobiales bacterium]
MRPSSSNNGIDADGSLGAGPFRVRPFLLLALGLFAASVAAWRPVPAGVWHDDGVYMLVGKAISEGHGLAYAGVVDHPPAAKFPPLYPLVLAVLWTVLDGIGPVTLAATFLNFGLLAGAGALFARALVASGTMATGPAVTVAALAYASADVMRTALLTLSESLFVFLVAASLALWPRVEKGDRRESGLLALALVAIVATRTAGLALVLAFAIVLIGRRGVRAAGTTVGPAVAFAGLWGWWSRRASQSIPEGARDLLGPYGSWLAEQTLSEPIAFLADLPSHALGLLERATAMTFPGVTGFWIWILGLLLVPVALVGLARLLRTFPPLGWFGLVYAAVLLVWPYLDRRLLVPWHAVLLTALVLGGRQAYRRLDKRGLARVATGLAAVWVVAYASVTAGRIAAGWPTEAYRVRSDRLAASVEALGRTAPDDAVIGAPEFWAALHLHGGWTVSPSVRFDPRNLDTDRPMWGTAEEQLRLWRTLGIDHLLLEQNGVLHGAALDRLEEACPGTVEVLARMPTSMVVRLAWDDGCDPLRDGDRVRPGSPG